MTSFSYTAIRLDGAGASVTGHLDAPSEHDLRSSLHARGLLLIEALPRAGKSRLGLRRARHRATTRQARWFFETLSTLLDGAAPLDSAVSTMETLAPTAELRSICSRIRAALRRGSTLADALSSEPGLIRARHAGLIRVGEDVADLPRAAGLVHQSLESEARLRSVIVSRSLYPLVVLLVALAALWGLSTFVIPRFADSLGAMGVALPLPTRITLTLASALVWLIPAFIALAITLALTRQRWLTASLRTRISRRALRLPVLGSNIWNLQSAALSDTLGVLLEGGATLTDALRQSLEVVSSPEIARRFEAASRDVRSGADLGRALEQHDVLPPRALAMVRAGLESGDLAPSLRRASSACVDEQDRRVQRILTLLEPSLVGALALVVLWVIYSLVSGMLALNDLQGL